METSTTKLKIEVEREEDGRWMAEATELPGCMVYGKTRADAVAKVKELAEHVFADLPNATLNLEEDSAELEAELLKAADSPVKPMRESELREIADQALREFRTRGVKSAKK